MSMLDMAKYKPPCSIGDYVLYRDSQYAYSGLGRVVNYRVSYQSGLSATYEVEPLLRAGDSGKPLVGQSVCVDVFEKSAHKIDADRAMAIMLRGVLSLEDFTKCFSL